MRLEEINPLDEVMFNYHIYGLVQNGQKEIERYVADGPSNIADGPHVLKRRGKISATENLLLSLASGVHPDHLDYLERRGFADGVVNHIGFSFTPPCDNVVSFGQIYHTKQLSGDEQYLFLKYVQEEVKKNELEVQKEIEGNR